MQKLQTSIAQSEHPVLVGQQSNAIPLEVLRAALFQAAWHATIAAVAYRIAVTVESRRGSAREAINTIASAHADELATDADAISGLWSTVLGLEDAAAPLGWAIQEVIEWVDASYRYHEMGEEDQRVPLSWSPVGLSTAPLRLDGVVEQRLRLLRVELDDYGVNVIDRQ